MKRVDLVTALVLLAFGLLAASESLRLGLSRQGLPGDGLFPLLASVGIIVLAAILVVESRGGGGEPMDWPGAESLKKTALFCVALVVYVFLTVPLGFFLATVLFLVALIRYPGGYPWKTNLAVSVPLACALYFGLGLGLGVELPHGILALIGL